ncbi:unnamed protein product [Effrenium voratum]|uniref:Uncharacterized protein n=1 Tax=Effrenium voratum TaxID=2562239 RepID=A0AA36N2G8_9DINO|nr:unnamed protein product [Effrenium voratum]
MMMESGDFKALENEVAKYHAKILQKEIQVQWVTKNWLMRERHWTKSMCDNAFAWAKEKGLYQVNPVHKEEEASLVIENFYKVQETEGQTMTQRASFETEACEIQGHLDELNKHYEHLSKLQGDAMASSDPRSLDKSIKEVMAEVTKRDVAMNNCIVRDAEGASQTDYKST